MAKKSITHYDGKSKTDNENHTNRNSFTRTNGTAHSSNYVLCLSSHQSNQPNSEPYKSHWKTHLTHWKTPQFRREIFRHRVTQFEPSTDSIRAVLTEKMSKFVVLDRELKFGHGADYGNSTISARNIPSHRVMQFEPSANSIRAVLPTHIIASPRKHRLGALLTHTQTHRHPTFGVWADWHRYINSPPLWGGEKKWLHVDANSSLIISKID